MKQKLPIFLFVLFLSFDLHPIHICLTQINFNQSNHSLEITHRIFWRDFEEALQEHHQNLMLGKDTETPKAEKYITDYLDHKFGLDVNQKKVNVKYLGREYEHDIMLVYMEVNKVEDLKTAKVYHGFLHEMFDDQQNITNFVIQGHKTGSISTRSKPNAQFSF